MIRTGTGSLGDYWQRRHMVSLLLGTHFQTPTRVWEEEEEGPPSSLRFLLRAHGAGACPGQTPAFSWSEPQAGIGLPPLLPLPEERGAVTLPGLTLVTPKGLSDGAG